MSHIFKFPHFFVVFLSIYIVGATTLVDLVVKAGLADTVSTGGPFTVFAPTNEAFNKLPASLLATLQSDVELLKKVIFKIIKPKLI